MKLLHTRLVKILWLSVALSFVAAAPAYGQDARLHITQFDKYANQALDVIDVTVDDNLLQLAERFLRANKSADEAKVKELIRGLKGVYVKRFTFEKEGEYSMSDVEAFRAQLQAPWMRIVGVRSKRQGNFDVFIMSEGAIIKGLAVLAAEPRALTVVNIIGNIDLDKLRDLEGKFGIPNLDLERGDSAPERVNKDKRPDENNESKVSGGDRANPDSRDEKKKPELIRSKPPKE
jgi:hypothetical protein